MLAAAWPRLKIENGIVTNLDAEVIAPLRAFCRRSIDTMSVAWGSVLPGKSIGDVLATHDDMFNKVTLQDLPESPQFVFDATNLQTGRLVRLMKKRLADFTSAKSPIRRSGRCCRRGFERLSAGAVASRSRSIRRAG